MDALSSGLMLPSELLRPKKLRGVRQGQTTKDPLLEVRQQIAQRPPLGKARDVVLAAILGCPELLPDLEERSEAISDLFTKDLPKRLLSKLRERLLETGELPTGEGVLRQWLTLVSGDSRSTEYVLHLSNLSDTLGDPRQALSDGVSFIERKQAERRLGSLREDLRCAWQAGDEAKAQELELKLSRALRPPQQP